MNASHFSARYAERKRQAQRARDAAMGPQPCLICPSVQQSGSVFCSLHAAEHADLIERGDLDVACKMTSRRTYWGPVLT